MAHAHPFPWQGGESAPATPLPDAGQDVAAAARRRRNLRRAGSATGATAALLAVTLTVSASAASRKNRQPEDGAHGFAPALAPSNRAPSPLESAIARATGSPGSTGGATVAPTPNVHYDDGKGITCSGLRVTRPDSHTLHILPTVQRTGNPDPRRAYTVVDFFSGPADNEARGKTYVKAGYGAAVDIPVPADLDWKRDAATVFIAYYPPGVNIPDTPEGHSVMQGPEAHGRVAAACGNAVTTMLLQGGVSTVAS